MVDLGAGMIDANWANGAFMISIEHSKGVHLRATLYIIEACLILM